MQDNLQLKNIHPGKVKVCHRNFPGEPIMSISTGCKMDSNVFRTPSITVMAIVLAVSAAFAQPPVIKVWQNGAPGSHANPAYREDTLFLDGGRPRIYRVTDPELTAFFPANDRSAHSAVVVCPGGGYVRLAMDHEGYDIARWLAESGVTAFLLKYRLPSDTIMDDKSVGPLQDVQEAIRIVRRRAVEWGIDPARIGVMGFSSGGHLAGSASTLYGKKVYDNEAISARPDFSVLIYGALSMQESIAHSGSRKRLLGEHPDTALVNEFSAECRVTAQTPPAFIVHAANDSTVPVANSIAYFSALKRNGVPAELHLYEKGGHGFGLAKGRGTASGWPDACIAWLRERGFAH